MVARSSRHACMHEKYSSCLKGIETLFKADFFGAS